MKPSRFAVTLTIAVALALLAGEPARSQSFAVGNGSSVGLGTAIVDLGCSDVAISGTLAASASTVLQTRHLSIGPGGVLDAGSSQLTVTGDWGNAGTFVPGTSTVSLTDGCGTAASTVSGSSSFHALSLRTLFGKTFLLESGSTQVVTSALTLAGLQGARLVLQSTIGGSEAFLDLQGGTQDITSVEVADVHAIGDTLAADATSALAGNTTGWVLFGRPVPALPWLALLALASALTAVARRALRATRGAHRRSGFVGGSPTLSFVSVSRQQKSDTQGP